MKKMITNVPLVFLFLFISCYAATLRDTDGDELVPEQEYYLRSALFGGGFITLSCSEAPSHRLDKRLGHPDAPFVVIRGWNDMNPTLHAIKFYSILSHPDGDKHPNVLIQFVDSSCPEFGLWWTVESYGDSAFIGVRNHVSRFSIAPHPTSENAYSISSESLFVTVSHGNGFESLVMSYVDNSGEILPIQFLKKSAAALPM